MHCLPTADRCDSVEHTLTNASLEGVASNACASAAPCPHPV